MTEQAYNAGLGIPVGMLVLHEIDLKGARRRLDARAKQILETIQGRWSAIQENLEAYDKCFESWGYTCPLSAQIQAIREKGLPSAPPLIQALLLCEATQGVLMGIQDRDLVQGTVLLDLAGSGEEMAGLKGSIPCKIGEPVLRDGAGLLASYFQGPDRRTVIHSKTRSVMFLALGTPNMPRRTLEAALATVLEALEGAFALHEGPAYLEGGQVTSNEPATE